MFLRQVTDKPFHTYITVLLLTYPYYQILFFFVSSLIPNRNLMSIINITLLLIIEFSPSYLYIYCLRFKNNI